MKYVSKINDKLKRYAFGFFFYAFQLTGRLIPDLTSGSNYNCGIIVYVHLTYM